MLEAYPGTTRQYVELALDASATRSKTAHVSGHATSAKIGIDALGGSIVAEGGRIRTSDTVARITHQRCIALSRSATPPGHLSNMFWNSLVSYQFVMTFQFNSIVKTNQDAAVESC